LINRTNNYRKVKVEDRFASIREAITIATECKDTVRLISALRTNGIINGHLGNYDRSYNSIWNALLLAEASGNKELQLDVYSNLSRYYGYLKRSEKAIEFIDKAESIIKELNLSEDAYAGKYLSTLLTKASMYREFNQFDKSELYLDSCFYYSLKVSTRSYFPYLNFEKAIHLDNEGSYEEALEIYFKVAEHMKRTNPGFLTLVYNFIGQTYFNIGDYVKCEEYYKNALAISQKYDRHNIFQPIIYENLSKLYTKQNNYKAAFEAQRQQKDLDYLVFDGRSQKNSSLFEIHDEYAQFKREHEISTKNLELEALNQNKKLFTLQRLLFLAILAFTLFAVFVFYKAQKLKLEKEKQQSMILEKEYELKKKLSENLANKNEKLVTYSHIMSHDLKAPINTIKAFSGLLKKNSLNGNDKSKNIEFIDFISNSADSMSQLIEDLLTYSKIENNNYAFSETDLNDVVQSVLPSFQYSVTMNNANIEIGDLPTIKGNASILKTVFHNLISNALKYQPTTTSEHTPNVELWSSDDNGLTKVYIKDNGIGIKEDYKDNLFVPFKRFHSADDYKGTGLGMSICKKIMENHNGSIELVESSKDGSTFMLLFPS